MNPVSEKPHTLNGTCLFMPVVMFSGRKLEGEKKVLISRFSNFLSQMSRHVTTMAKCTRLETSGRRNTWVPSAPVPAMEGSRCVRM